MNHRRPPPPTPAAVAAATRFQIASSMHRSTEELKAGLPHILQSPRDGGRVDAIVVRPETDSRQDVPSCRFDIGSGALGDRWVQRFASPPLPGMPDQDSQITLMNSRAAQLLAGSRERWALAGDQLYVDLDLGVENLRPGDRLRAGSVLLEVSPMAHDGCAKFAKRYGVSALALVNSPEGKRMHLRGIYARVVQPGVIQVGDAIRKEAPASANHPSGS